LNKDASQLLAATEVFIALPPLRSTCFKTERALGDEGIPLDLISLTCLLVPPPRRRTVWGRMSLRLRAPPNYLNHTTPLILPLAFRTSVTYRGLNWNALLIVSRQTRLASLHFFSFFFQHSSCPLAHSPPLTQPYVPPNNHIDTVLGKYDPHHNHG
jgi:hypothetical protein